MWFDGKWNASTLHYLNVYKFITNFWHIFIQILKSALNQILAILCIMKTRNMNSSIIVYCYNNRPYRQFKGILKLNWLIYHFPSVKYWGFCYGISKRAQLQQTERMLYKYKQSCHSRKKTLAIAISV